MTDLYWGATGNGDAGDSSNWFTLNSQGQYQEAGTIPGIGDIAEFGEYGSDFGTISGNLLASGLTFTGSNNYDFTGTISAQYLQFYSPQNLTFDYGSSLSISTPMEIMGSFTINGTASLGDVYLSDGSVMLDDGDVILGVLNAAYTGTPQVDLGLGATLSSTDANFAAAINFNGTGATLALLGETAPTLDNFQAGDVVDVSDFSGYYVGSSGSLIALGDSGHSKLLEAIHTEGSTPIFIISSDGNGGTEFIGVAQNADNQPPPEFIAFLNEVMDDTNDAIRDFVVSQFIRDLKADGAPIDKFARGELTEASVLLKNIAGVFSAFDKGSAVISDYKEMLNDFAMGKNPKEAAQKATADIFGFGGTIFGTFFTDSLAGSFGGALGQAFGNAVFPVLNFLTQVAGDFFADLASYVSAVAGGEDPEKAAHQALENIIEQAGFTGQIAGQNNHWLSSADTCVAASDGLHVNPNTEGDWGTFHHI